MKNYFHLENMVYYLEAFLKKIRYILKSNDLESSKYLDLF